MKKRVHQLLSSRPVRFFEQVDSTQDVALQWLHEGAVAGSVVIADEQLKGRGRQGRTWHTPPCVALAVSVILKPVLEQLPQITMLGALAIAGMLDSIGVQNVSIKWPNDVQVDGRKISGVLPEAVWDGHKLRGVALGMGVNVRNDFRASELEQTATSIESVLGRTVDRGELLVELLNQVDAGLKQMRDDTLFDTWRSLLNTLGREVTIHDVTGTAEAVDRQGALLVRDSAGVVHRILAGDVAFGR